MNKISDKKLKYIAEASNHVAGGSATGSETKAMAQELLTLRQQNAELIENSERLAEDNERMCRLIGRNTDEQKHVEEYYALMSRIKEGEKGEAESNMDKS